MKYIGLDIHKKDTQACVLDEKGKVVLVKRVRTDVSDIGHLFKKIEDDTNDELAVVMEATGFYFWINDLIVARGHDVKVVHPTKVKPLMNARSKTDKNDALMLAELLRAGCLEGIYIPSPEIREMRDLTRHRESLVRKKGDAKREIIAALDQRGLKVPSEFRTNFTQKYKDWARSLNDFVINEKLDLLELLLTKIRNVEKIIEDKYGMDEDVQLMRTVPGIGLVTAAVVKAEIGDVSRFSSAENLAAYVGVSPTTSQSGEKTWGGPTRHGNNRVKHVLIEATLFHYHYCPDSKISSYYQRKKDSIGSKKAMVATSRKLVEALYCMMTRKEVFHAH
jgi:transposase